MKQAIDWIEEQSKNPPRRGSLEMKAMLEAVQAIQLDAWRQGMTDAASLPNHTHSVDAVKCVFVTDIALKRDQTKSV